MIGKVTNSKGTFVLSDEGKWSGDDPDTVAHLNDKFDPCNYMYPASGLFGYLAVYEAAADIDGKASGLEELPEAPPGQIY